MPTIAQLTADQLAQHAFNIFVRQGRHRLGARLIYRALELDPRNASALRCLSDLFDHKGTKPFSAVALEYALHPSTAIAGDARDVLDNLLFFGKWSWGFSRHKTGQTALGPDDFKDRTAFRVDERKYKDYLINVLKPAKSLGNAFRSAHVLCGLIGGVVEHHSKGDKVRIYDTYDPAKFKTNAEYAAWLRCSTDSLDAMTGAIERDRVDKVTDQDQEPTVTHTPHS
jgi:hypothetical protein